ncbi:NAD(P)-dependent oxidoreductase [Falsibacillus albus]|uniref:NAD(P)-dependent oxidoreductase n=1 Tax=Falsibacillus albus TaxID=2478915 RepID=UPI002279A2B3|nr:NAD(P)-dependent oxidoreductase [Falsibacillus albus]
MELRTIGFIGTGVMGQGMVRNLINEGYSVYIYNRTHSKGKVLVEEGAFWCDTIKDLSSQVDMVITMVGYPKDVEDIYFGAEGIIANAKPGTILADMTTSTPTLAKKIYKEALEKGMHAIDAPVSGGDIGAKNGTLTIMAGGDEEAFRSAGEVFRAMGKNIVYQGGAGSGQHTKMCNQIAIASNMIGVCEALVYAEKAGLNAGTVLESISFGAAGSWSLSNLAPRILKEDYSPGFFIKHFIKDMSIALEEAEKMDLKLPGLKMAKQMYEELSNDGEENSGTQALIKYWLSNE